MFKLLHILLLWGILVFVFEPFPGQHTPSKKSLFEPEQIEDDIHHLKEIQETSNKLNTPHNVSPCNK